MSILFLFAIMCGPVFGQFTPAVAGVGVERSAKRFMPVADVREGMRGKARTVFRGTEPEEFEVEILGVVPGAIGPKQDLIVGRISGGNADRTAVFAGMSGSPVFVDGKLVGAISYSFPFSKEAICGITPIEQMIGIFEQGSAPSNRTAEPKGFSFSEYASATPMFDEPPSGSADRLLAAPGGPLLAAANGQYFRPIGTPLTFSGISQATLDTFAPQLVRRGIIPVAAAGGAAPLGPLKPADDKTLVGGDSVSMHLTRGDFSMAASGTVTLRDGDKIYAFGHPFLSLGSADLPMSESSVVTVIPNINNSFKLAVPDAMVGSMTQDRATGVFGKLGTAPKMIPVRMNYRNSRGQRGTFNYEIARDDFLTPLLLNITIFNSIGSQERSIGDSTVVVDGTITVRGEQPVSIKRRFTGGQAAIQAAGSIAVPVNTLLRNSFDKLEISQIEIDLDIADGVRAATLERIAVDRGSAKPGETVELTAFARTNAGKLVSQRVPVTLPSDAPPGAVTITLGDGATIQKNEPIQHFVPGSLSDLIATMNKVRASDRMYLKVTRTTPGIVLGASELPNLPPSVLATISSDRTSAALRAATQSVIGEMLIAPSEFIISGEQSVTIMISR